VARARKPLTLSALFHSKIILRNPSRANPFTQSNIMINDPIKPGLRLKKGDGVNSRGGYIL